ncbi:MAG: hypothetical protein ACK5Z4_08180 [Planctomyces sp.]
MEPSIVGMIGPALAGMLAMLVLGRRVHGEALTRQVFRAVVCGWVMYAVLVAAPLLARAAGISSVRLADHAWTLVGIAITIAAISSAIAHIIVPVERDDAGSTEDIGSSLWRSWGSARDLSAPPPWWFRPMRAVACIAALVIAPTDRLAPIMVIGVLVIGNWIAKKLIDARPWTEMAATAPRTVASAQSEISHVIAQAQRTRPGTGPTPPVPPTTT